MESCGHAISSSASWGAASRTCSKLSSTRSSRFDARNASTAWQQSLSPWLTHPEDTGDSRQDQRRIGEWREIDEPDTVGEGIERFGGDGQRKPCLASPTRSGQGDESGALALDHRRDMGDLRFAADQRRELHRQIGFQALECSRRREARLESRGEHLPDAFGFQQIAQPVLAEIEQGHGGRRGVVDQRSRRVGEHDLAAMRDREEPAQPVERGHLVVVARGIGRGLADVQRHAHPNRSGQRPGFSGDRLLRRNRGGKRVGSSGEGGLHGVADDLEAIPAMGSDRRVEQLEMAVYREAHRRLVLLPERRASLDIREEEGDGAGGEIGHGRSNHAGRWCCGPIVTTLTGMTLTL